MATFALGKHVILPAESIVPSIVLASSCALQGLQGERDPGVPGDYKDDNLRLVSVNSSTGILQTLAAGQ